MFCQAAGSNALQGHKDVVNEVIPGNESGKEVFILENCRVVKRHLQKI